MPSSPCPKGCTCGKHVSNACPEGCTCGKHSAETRAKISAARLGKPNQTGLVRSFDTRLKMKAAWTPQRRVAQAERARVMGSKLTHEQCVAAGLAAAKKGPRRNTQPELLLQEALQSIGVKFTTHVNVNSYNIDIMLDDGTLVEVDGSYWHSLPKMRDRDARKDEWATATGHTLHRFSGLNVEDAPAECAYLATI